VISGGKRDGRTFWTVRRPRLNSERTTQYFGNRAEFPVTELKITVGHRANVFDRFLAEREADKKPVSEVRGQEDIDRGVGRVVSA